MSEKKEIDERIELDEPKKKSKFGLFFFLFIFICLVGLLAYKYITFNPIMSLIDKIPTSNKNTSEEPVKLTGNFTVESANKEYKLFSAYSIDFSETYDAKNNKSLVNININEGDASLIDFIVYQDEKNYYFESSKLYDGKIKLNEESIKSLMSEGDASGISLPSFDINAEDSEYIAKIVKQSLKNSFKDVKYVRAKKELDINGKKVKTLGYTYKINKDNIQKVYDNFINTFEDEELIKIFEKNNLKREDYNELLKYFKEQKIEDFESNIEFTIYVNPYLLNYVGLSISENGKEIVSAVSDKDYAKVIVYFYDEDNTTFVSETKGDNTEFEFNVGSMSAIKGTVVKKDDNEFNFTMDIANELTIKLNTQYKENAVMDNYDVSEAIKFEELNDEDFASMMYNLQVLSSSSPLIQSLFTFFQDDDIEASAQNIYVSAYQMYTNDSKKNKKSEYVYGNGNKCSNALPISLNDNVKYAIKINKKGKVTYFQITDGEQQYSYKGSNFSLDNIKFTDYKGLKVTCK